NSGVWLPVNRIAEDRPSAPGEMNADLMRAPGHQLASDRRMRSMIRQDVIPRLARWAPRRDDDPPTVVGIPRKGQHDPSLCWLRRSTHERQVLLACSTRCRILLHDS